MGVRRLLAVCAALMLAGSLWPSNRPALAASADVSAQQTLINQDRAGTGLAALSWSSCLAAVAVQNAERIMTQGYLSHTNGPTLNLACGQGATQGGENIAYISSGINDPQANTMFMNSPGHKANILGPYQYVATAWAVAPNGYAYIAEEFLGASAPLVPGGYHPLPPARILDTRTGTGGVPVAPLGANATLTVPVVGRGGVPATGVGAVVLNVTVTNTSVPSFLTVYPAEDPRPTTSNLNWTSGQTTPNLVQVAVRRSGQLAIYNAYGSTDVVFDVAGYVPLSTASPGPDGFYNPLVPARLLDTRNGTGAIAAPILGGSTLTLQVTGRGGVPSSGVSAVVLNVTVTAPTIAGYVTVFPAGTALPNASNLNFIPGQTVPNRVIVKLGAGGQVSFFNSAGSAQIIADVNGWYTDASVPGATGSVFTGVTPVRILDTRYGTGGFSSRVGPGGTIVLTVAGWGGVPLMTSTSPVPPTAVVLNVTVTNPSAASHLILFPDGAAQPTTSDLNFLPGQTIPNLVVVRLGSNGKLDIFNLSGTTDVIADVVGWYG
jgi:hypothetical protein